MRPRIVPVLPLNATVGDMLRVLDELGIERKGYEIQAPWTRRPRGRVLTLGQGHGRYFSQCSRW